MAKLNFEHGYFAAGLSGESFDICDGYNVTYTTSAADAAFSGANTITLTAGTFPTWLREVGKVFVISGTTLNNGTFTVVSIDLTFKILTVLETTVVEAAQTPTFDGSADTKLIDVLLKAGNGVLTTDAPLVLYSTGTLGAARTLDIASLEKENTAQGGQDLQGRFFYLSVQNSDVSNSNTITISTSTGGGSINGLSTLVIRKPQDYIFHFESSGLWRANILTRPGEAHATIAMIPFVAADWSAGTVNEIEVIQTGVPTGGQVGPHGLKVYPHYIVQVCDETLTKPELVDVETQFDVSGNIKLIKAQKAKPFSGTVLIVSSLD
jgi:hypothetical protein